MVKLTKLINLLIVTLILTTSYLPLVHAAESTSLTLFAANRVSKDGKVTFSGSLKSGATKLTDRPIKFYFKKHGTSSFVFKKTVRTNENGNYSFATTSTYGIWHTTFPGGSKYAGSKSTNVRVQVVTRMTLASSVSPNNPAQNSWPTFTGTVKDQFGFGIPGASVKFSVYYKTTTTHYDAGLTANPSGKATKDFGIGRATKGYKVTVKSTANWKALSASSVCYFTPQ